MTAAVPPIFLWPLLGLSVWLFAYLVYPAIDRNRWGVALDTSREGMMEAGLGILFLVLLFSPVMIPAMIIIVLVHEYGHVLAYRLIGHRHPRMRIAPFGGVAFSGERYKSQAEGAFVALMGPGFSVLLLVILSAASWALVDVNPVIAGYLYHSAFLVGFLNGLNLLPFYPLDGGHALRAAATSISYSFAHSLALVMSGALGLFALLMKFWFLLIIAVIGLGGAMQAAKLDAGTRSMRPMTALLTLATHAALLAAHFFFAWGWLERVMTRALSSFGA